MVEAGLLGGHVLGVVGLVAHVVLLGGVDLGAVHGDAVVAAAVGELDARPHGLLQVRRGRGGRAGAVGQLLAATRNRVPVGVVTLPADDFGQDPPSGVDEPVADLNIS